MKWFRELLEQTKKKQNLSQKQTGKILGVSQKTVSNYLNGETEVSLSAAVKLLNHTGGDIQRALPDWRPEQNGDTIQVLGDVMAGGTDYVQENREELDVQTLNWPDSSLWSYCDRKEPIVYLRVFGESMEPAYPNRSLIACRAPNKGLHLKNGWPCVLRDKITQEITFKRFYKMEGKGGREYAIGQAINPSFNPIVFPKGCDVLYLVLGKIQPSTFAPPELDAPIFREENGE